MDELQIMNPPEPTASSSLLLEQVPQMRVSLLKDRDWQAIASDQVRL